MHFGSVASTVPPRKVMEHRVSLACLRAVFRNLWHVLFIECLEECLAVMHLDNAT